MPRTPSLAEIDSRRKAYIDFVRTPLEGRQNLGDSSPFASLTPEKRRNVERLIDTVKTSRSIQDVLRTIHTVLQEVSGNNDPAVEAEALRRIQEAIFPRLAKLYVWLDDAAITGVLPEESGFQSEEQLQAELEILQFIYGQADIDEVRAFTPRPAAIEAKQITPEAKRRMELEKIESLPNDFMRFLADHEVSHQLLNLERGANEGDQEYRERLRKKFLIIGDIYYSLLLNRTSNDMDFEALKMPDIIGSHGAIGQFRGKEASGQYNPKELIDTVTSGLSGIAKEEAGALVGRFTGLFNTLGSITHVAFEVQGIQDVENLSKLYWPMGDKKADSKDQKTWFDEYFWSQITGGYIKDETGNYVMERGQKVWTDGTWIEVRHRHYDPSQADNPEADYGWIPAEKNLQEQFLDAVGGIVESAQLPGHKTSVGASLPLLLSGLPEKYRPATSYIFYENGRRAGDKRYKPKMIRDNFYSPTRLFPIRTPLPTDEKAKRVKTLHRIRQRVASNERSKPGVDISARYTTLLAANLFEAWLESQKQDCELKLAKGFSWEEVLRLNRSQIQRPTGMSDEAFTAYQNKQLSDPFLSEDPYIQSRLEAAFTVEDMIFDPGSMGIPGYVEPISVTLIEYLTLNKVLIPNVSGIREIDKSMHKTTYNAKVVRGEENVQSSYQVRAMGVVKQMYFTYGDYFYDPKTGESLNDLLIALSKKNLSQEQKKAIFRRIAEAVPGGATQAWGGAMKDAATLDKIQEKGLSGGSLLNIAELDVKTSEVDKINETYIASLRGFFRTLYGYQYSRDLCASAEFEKNFFDPTKANELVSPRVANDWIVVRVKDLQSNTQVSKLIRAHKTYHLQPHDLYRALDKDALQEGRTYGDWVDPYRGVNVMEITINGVKNIRGFEPLKPNASHDEQKSYMKEYIDVLMMRHLITMYFYMFSGADVLQSLKRKDKLLFGMVFSSEIRRKFEEGEYTVGPTKQILKNIAKSLLDKHLDPDFWKIETPDIKSMDLFSERGFYTMLLHMGYINSIEDVIGEFQKQANELAKAFHGK